MRTHRQRDFTLREALEVVAIVLIVAAMARPARARPKMRQIIDAQKLWTSAQAYASLLHQARAKDAADDAVYQFLTEVTNVTLVAYVHLNHNRQYGAATPTSLRLEGDIYGTEESIAFSTSHALDSSIRTLELGRS